MNYCLTYFRVLYDEKFDMIDFCKCLGIDYEYYKNFGTDVSMEIGRNEIYDVDINKMVRITLKDLFGKEDVLVMLKEKYNLEYYLERVLGIYCDGVHPILSLDADIIEFLYKSKTIDDLDYYIYEGEDFDV